MGGCRCTYRNCTVKSDGEVHLFHYPVFEKLRCHQWLMNAHRLDFLDLRVSQLKNRVVCQHHFKDDNFMNYKKDKLKFDAIPTEDGPYCDSSEWSSLPVINKLCPIIPEDIENTYCAAYDKKTNYSLRYGDFLTNSEPSDFNDLDINKNNNLNNENPLLNVRKCVGNSITLNDGCTEICIRNNNLNNNALQDANKMETHSLLEVQPRIMIHSNKRISVKGGKGSRPRIKIPVKEEKRSRPGIKIISEKKIRDPIPIKGNLKNISPSVTLPPPKKNSLYVVPTKVENIDAKSTKVENIDAKSTKVENIAAKSDTTNTLNNINFDKSYVVQVEYDPSQTAQDQLALNNTSQSVIQDSSIVQYPLNDVNITQDDNKLQITFSDAAPNTIIKEIPASPQSKQLLRKVKLTPERKAAIDSKREFNKMLRNVIHACLDTKESAENSTDCTNTNKIEAIKKQLCLELKDTKKENELRSRQKQIRLKPVVQNQSILKPSFKKPNIPVEAVDKNSILTFLEARMQILESNVITRIDHNAKQISELREQFAKGPSKNCSTQTYENAECYKKFLYQEISKFLSPSCNSSIYEELFINKYSVKGETAQPRAKRRRR